MPHPAASPSPPLPLQGDGLEAAIACPAWAPVLSLESVDGPLWRDMRDDFNALMRVLPPGAKLQAAGAAQVDALLGSGATVDADAVVRWSAATFLEYLFDIKEWRPEYEVLVQASWEWRREIAVRGPADAAVKAAAVALLTDTLLPGAPALWAVHGEAWREPRYYSLIMQPFLISPCINLSDIAVRHCGGQHCGELAGSQRAWQPGACTPSAVRSACPGLLGPAPPPATPLQVALATAPPGVSAEAAVRAMHPFPIFERYCEAPVLHPATGAVAVPARSHVIMFTAGVESLRCCGCHSLPVQRTLHLAPHTNCLPPPLAPPATACRLPNPVLVPHLWRRPTLLPWWPACYAAAGADAAEAGGAPALPSRVRPHVQRAAQRRQLEPG